MEEEETSTDYDTDDSDDDDKHAPLFRNSFPINSHFDLHSMDEVNRYLIINFLFLCYHLDNYFTRYAVNFLVPMVYDNARNRDFYDRKCFSTSRKKVKQPWKYMRTTG